MSRVATEMPSFVDALNDEVAELEEQLRRNPVYVKLQKARALLADYVVDEVRRAGVSASPHQTAPVAATRPFSSGASAQIIQVVREYLADKQRPVPTRILMEVIEKSGIKVAGSVPQNSVSSILSKSEDVQANGRSGWTLKKNSAGGPPTQGNPPADTERQVDFLTETHAKGREAVPGGGT